MKYNELTVLVPCHSLEDFPTELQEWPAESLLNAFSVLWHPLLLASSGAFPRWERGDEANDATAGRLIIVPTATAEQVPKSWIERARREGSTVVSGKTKRDEMLAEALAPLDEKPDIDAELVADFLALGTVYLHVELLTRHMRNFSQLDEVHMQREAVAAAKAAIDHDAEATRKHLHHCFEMLQECRERFYPVDSFLIDLCLVNPDLADDQLRAIVADGVPVNLLAPVSEWEEIVAKDESWKSTIQAGVEAKTVELISGGYSEVGTTLTALDSVVADLERGNASLKEMFGATPKVWGRKRFGVGAHMPQILDKLGFTGALHFVMDDGIYPDEEQSHLRWEGADGTAIDATSRIPMATDSASAFLRFPLRMSESMDYDHTAAVVFARWPTMKTPWFNDFRRAHQYVPVFGKFVTLSEFFEGAESPGRMSEFKAGDYFSPSLVHAVARQSPNPVSRYLDYWTRWRAFETTEWCRSLSTVLRKEPLIENTELTASIEAADAEADANTLAKADELLATASSASHEQMARLITGEAPSTDGETPGGLLVVNPLSFERNVVVNWPDGTSPGTEPTIKHRQVSENESCAVVTVPADGFVWLKAEKTAATTPVGKLPLAEGLVLRNDFFEVRLSDVTGGISGVQTFERSPNRVSQQIAYRFPNEKTVTVGEGDERESFSTWYSAMTFRSSRVLSSGPAMGAIETTGDLIDQQTGAVLANYKQVTRVYRGKPFVYVHLELENASAVSGDPWTNYCGVRFAWKHESASLTASQHQGAHAVRSQRIESPQFIEIADEQFRTTIVSPGLTFHRRTGERMLDTILITEGESRRQFDFAVAVDSKFPMQSHLDANIEPLVIATPSAPTPGREQGWFFFVGASNVQLTRVLPSGDGGDSDKFIVRLIETEGRAKTFPLRYIQSPQSARQVDFNGNRIADLNVQGDSIQVEISPYEICDVELNFKAT